MKKITLNIDIQLAQIDELPEEDQQLVKMAIEQTEHSYSPYSHFSVGAALRLGETRSESLPIIIRP